MCRWKLGIGLVARAVLSSSIPTHIAQYWEERYFDDAGEWDDYEIDFATLHELVSDRVENIDIKRILIPGCGTSQYSHQAVEKISGVKTIGVDFSNVVIEAMRDRIPAKYSKTNTISYVHMDVLEMGQSFGSETMDMIIDKSMLDTLRLRPDAGNAVSSYLETLHFLLSSSGLAVFISPTRPQNMIPILHNHPDNGWNCGDIRGLPRARPLSEKFEVLDASWTNITVYLCNRVRPGESNKDAIINHVLANDAFGRNAERMERKYKADLRAEEENRLYQEKMKKMQEDIERMEDARTIRAAQRAADEEAELQAMLVETERMKQQAAEEAAQHRRQLEEADAATAAATALEIEANKNKQAKKKKGDVHCVGFWDDWSSCDESTCTEERFFSVMSRKKGEGRPCEAENNDREVRICDASCATEAQVRPADVSQEEIASASEPEFRIDPTDGNAYPVEEFQAFYPDWQARWESAEVWPPKADTPQVDTPSVEQTEPDVHCFGVWSDWSTCQADCSMSRSISHKTKRSGNGDACEREDGFVQTMECFHGGCKPNCVGDWTPWSDCFPPDQPGRCGVQSRSFEVVRQKQRPSDLDCEVDHGTTQMQDCDCPAEDQVEGANMDVGNCEAFWTERTACSAACTQELEYTVLAESDGGTPCEYEDGHVIVQDCVGGACASAEL